MSIDGIVISGDDQALQWLAVNAIYIHRLEETVEQDIVLMQRQAGGLPHLIPMLIRDDRRVGEFRPVPGNGMTAMMADDLGSKVLKKIVPKPAKLLVKDLHPETMTGC